MPTKTIRTLVCGALFFVSILDFLLSRTEQTDQTKQLENELEDTEKILARFIS